MIQFFTKKLILIIAVFALLGTISCQKEINESIDSTGDNTTPPTRTVDLTTRINSSVTGFVTDENDAAVNGATVRFGNATTTTDKYGYFHFSNISVVRDAAVVTVEKSGYFHGIKTYRAETGKSRFFRIKLIPKTTTGTINASSGGSATLSNGLTVALPSSGVVYASNNAPYSGTINVAAYWINPTAKDLEMIMPGDLRGIDNNGGLNELTTFGMCAVELTSPSGDLLQIAPGKKATLTFPIPAAMDASAPSSIILWYFDESKGLWIEDGTATKNGSSYVGDVSHFSFWNCDRPDDYIYLSCTLFDSNGNPIPYAWIRLSEVSDPWNTRGGITNDSGYVSGIIPANTQLQMEVYTNYYNGCPTPIYTQLITTGTSDITLNVTIPNSVPSQADVSGSVTDCNGLPVSNGYIIMQDGYYNYRYALNGLGQYGFSTILCNSTSNVTFIAEDASSAQQSTPLSYTVNVGNNVIPNLQACGTSISQYINYSVNGVPYSLTAPVDSFMMYVNPQTTPSSIYIYNMGRTTSGSSYVNFDFSNTGIGAGSVETLNNFYTSMISDSTVITTPVNVNITEYGSVGQFIAGNFTGTLTGAGPTFTLYNITCDFRVRRSQ